MIFQSLRVEGAVDGDDATGNGIHDRPVRDARPRIALAIKYRSSDAGGGWARLGKTEHDGRRTAYQGRRPLQFCWVWSAMRAHFCLQLANKIGSSAAASRRFRLRDRKSTRLNYSH